MFQALVFTFCANTCSVSAGPQPSSLKIPFYPKASSSTESGAENPIPATDKKDDMPGAPGPGSDTDEDEFYTVESPSSPTGKPTSPIARPSRSTVRPSSPTVKPSSSTVGSSSPTVRPSRKRSTDSSESSGSPKHARRSWKQHSINEPSAQRSPPGDSAFKKPTLEMARSYQATSFGKSLNTSVTTSANTSFATFNSSQQTQADTPMSSFASISYERVDYPKLPPTVSGKEQDRPFSPMKGALDDENRAAVEANAQLQQEAAWSRLVKHSRHVAERESTSTYGSIDETQMLETSFEIEVKGPSKPLPKAESLKRKPSVIPWRNFLQSPSSEASLFNRSPGDALDGTFESSPNQSELESNPVAKTPQKGSHQSPSKVSHWIRDIPENNLFMDEVPKNLKRFPYFVLFISARLATEHGISLTQLLRNTDAKSSLSNPKEFLDQLCTNVEIPCDSLSAQLRFWPARKKDFAGCTFKARINFNSGTRKPVFCLEVHPIATEKSCRFERKFGSDRFLYVSVPAFEHKTARFSKQEMSEIAEKWKTWCYREHSFLGRQWRVFHFEPIDKRNKRRVDEKWDKRVILFATRGIGIDQPMSIGEMVDWFFPLSNHENISQSYCKAFSRLDLGLSRTIPTHIFKPSEIRYTKDKKSDGTPEETKYNDPTLFWPRARGKREVMDDGCALMSVGAAMKIWKIVKDVTDSNEPMPSAFQGRIGGAKGVWMINDEHNALESNDEVWINITQSQLKFEPHEEDLLDDEHDPHRTTFDYLKHSHNPDPSELHKLFIPILADRGVPPDVIANIMVDYLDTERDQLIQNLSNPEHMYSWIHGESQSSSTLEPRWKGAIYESLPNMIKFLFESGFQPDQEPFFAERVLQFIKKRQMKMESQLRVPLCKSTFVLGVADPLGILAPGEVHMEFSTPFTDKSTGARVRDLSKMDILVSRQPACRRSDIQKVRAVKRPELSHLIDVVVFPRRGQYPLAGKLQGGDYDGDTFWICWDQAIVEPFRNAPAPMEPLNPTKYNIRQEKTLVSDLMDPSDLSTVDNFLEKSLEFRMTPSLLGIVTVFLEKQAYRENRVMSDCLDKLCDMHDLLVDAPKQGYTFTMADFEKYTRKTLGLRPPGMPAYKQAMEDCEKEPDDANPRNTDYKPKRTNVLDHLYFNVVRTHGAETLKMVEEVLSKEVPDDATLRHPYLYLHETGSTVVRQELDALVKKLKGVRNIWLDHWMNDNKERDDKLLGFDEIVERCYQAYCAIRPTAVDHPDVKPWVFPYKESNNFLWEDIRASAFYVNVPNGHKLVWYMAGKQLAKLKAESVSNSTMVVPNIKAIMRPKPPKVPKLEDDGYDSEYQSELEE